MSIVKLMTSKLNDLWVSQAKESVKEDSVYLEYTYIRNKRLIAHGLQGWKYEYYKKAISLVIQCSDNHTINIIEDPYLESITKEEFDSRGIPADKYR